MSTQHSFYPFEKPNKSDNVCILTVHRINEYQVSVLDQLKLCLKLSVISEERYIFVK